MIYHIPIFFRRNRFSAIVVSVLLSLSYSTYCDAQSVYEFIERLKSGDAQSRKEAAMQLGTMTDTSAIEPLIGALHDKDSDVRREAAGSLVKIDHPRVHTFLKNALNEQKLELIAYAHVFYVLLGEEGTEKVLIKALYKYGFEEMAQVFADSGNMELEKAAIEWAEILALQILKKGISDVRWGGGRK